MTRTSILSIPEGAWVSKPPGLITAKKRSVSWIISGLGRDSDCWLCTEIDCGGADAMDLFLKVKDLNYFGRDC